MNNLRWLFAVAKRIRHSSFFIFHFSFFIFRILSARKEYGVRSRAFYPHSSLRNRMRLLSDVQLRDDGTVTLDINLLQVVEQVSSVTNHLEQTSAAVVILVVGLQVLGQVVDTVGQKSDLNLRRTGVTLVDGIGLDNGLLFVFQHNGSIHLSK